MLGGVTRYERDAFGRPVKLIDPTGLITRLEWTIEGHLARRVSPDGTSESWTYDGEGNCTGHTDPLGGVTHFEYTHFDRARRPRPHHPQGRRRPGHTYVYDLTDQVAEATGPDGTHLTILRDQ